MAVQTTSTTSQNLSTKQVKFTHPTFALLQPVWQQLRDVREGTGGFLATDPVGSYLVAHPREWIDNTVKQTDADGKERWVQNSSPKVPTSKLRARLKLASYENFAATLVETLKSALTREQPIRRLGDGTQATTAPIEEWWDNCDGAGTHMDDFLAQAEDIAFTFGHVILYMDRPEALADAETAADVPMPFLRAYTPLDVWDWVVDDLGELAAVKFAEVAPRNSIDDAWKPEVRVRVVDRESWRLYDQKGALKAQGTHQFGTLPVVVLFSNRRPMDPHIGASVLGDPKLYIDLYNLKSEVRELLRNQTFALLNVPLGTGEGAMTATEAQTMMGNVTGTANVLFSGLAASYIQPESTNVQVYHLEMARVLRTIYRLASLKWESDSKDTESEGSLKIKREDMNQRLAKYADEMEKADYKLTELFYRAQFGADAALNKLEHDEVTIKYPDTFDLTPFDALLEQADAAMSLGMPAPFLKALRKILSRKFEGIADLPDKQLEEIDKAIESAPDDVTPQEQAQQRVEAMNVALKTGQAPKPVAVKGAAA